MSRRFAAMLIVASVFAAQSALADDVNPPSWRYGSNWTYQQWEFDTVGVYNDLPQDPYSYYATPDVYTNAFGIPTLKAYPGFGQSWQATYAGRTGVYPLSGTIVADIPNSSGGAYKDIWVQLTWKPQVVGNTPAVSTWQVPYDQSATLVSQQVLSDGWIHTTYSIHLEPNPTEEWVRIDGGIMVDELVIDTVCVPLPPVAFAGAGLLGLMGFVRRRRA